MSDRIAVMNRGVVEQVAGPLDGGTRLHGVVGQIVYLGMYTQYHVETGAGRIVSNRLADEELPAFELGSPVALSWEPEHTSMLGVAEHRRHAPGGAFECAEPSFGDAATDFGRNHDRRRDADHDDGHRITCGS
jgi:hypothetical protein